MPWAVRLSPAAQRHLFGLSMREAEIVSFNLFRLAEDPVQLSTQLSTPPTLEEPSGQEYWFRHAVASIEAQFRIVFRYDEHWETLVIQSIHREAARR